MIGDTHKKLKSCLLEKLPSHRWKSSLFLCLFILFVLKFTKHFMAPETIHFLESLLSLFDNSKNCISEGCHLALSDIFHKFNKVSPNPYKSSKTTFFCSFFFNFKSLVCSFTRVKSLALVPTPSPSSLNEPFFLLLLVVFKMFWTKEFPTVIKILLI